MDELLAPSPPCTRPTLWGGQGEGTQESRVALNAPVRSLEMLDRQIEAGATEVYVGLAAEELRVLTFNALARIRDREPTQVSSPELLEEIVLAAHAQGLLVHFAADSPYLPPLLHNAYVAHVRRAIAVGVDSVIVADVGLMALLRDSGIEQPLVASGYMAVSTVRFARYLHEAFGVTRVVLPNAMVLDEIAAFAQLPGLQIEVPVQTGAGNTCGRCMMVDSPVRPEIGLGCRAGYHVQTPEGTLLQAAQFLDGATDCALCSVRELIAVGVDALHIPGRESPNIRVNAKMTQLYRKAIDDAYRGKSLESTIAEIDEVELMWQMRWVPRFCNNARCRLLDTPTTRSYI